MIGFPLRETTAAVQENLDSLSDRVLVVGNLDRWASEGRLLDRLNGFEFVNIASLTAQTLNETAPDIILSPLFGDNFDAIDVATQLSELGFTGRYRVIAENVPNAGIIRNEVRNQAPDLDFDLLLMSADREAK